MRWMRLADVLAASMLLAACGVHPLVAVCAR
jgi:hypothetical protein